MLSRTELARLIKQVAYLEGDFVTRAGNHTHYYIDKYRFATLPHILSPLAHHLAALMPEGASYDRIGAPELGGVALAAAVSMVVDKPFVIIKKQAKAYGTQRLIEGQYNPQDRLILLEDILSTGGAVLRCADILEATGLTVAGIVGVINRQEGAFEAIGQRGYPVSALFTASDLHAA